MTDLPTAPITPVSAPPEQPLATPIQPSPIAPVRKSNTFIKIVIGIVVFAGMLMVILFALVRSYNSTLTVTPAKKPTIERIRQKGKIVIGTDATYQPMEFLDASGNFNGFDIELGNRITEKMGVAPEYKNVVFDNIFTALENKEVDIVISSVSITDERKKKFDFSNSYLNAGQVIITRKENETIKTTKDLLGKKIAVQSGTTNENQALQFTSADLVIRYEDYNEASKALVDKKVDAIFSDLTGAKGIVTASPGLKIASEPFTNEEYGIVFRKGEEDLVEEVNANLNILRQQGVLVFLKQKWLE